MCRSGSHLERAPPLSRAVISFHASPTSFCHLSLALHPRQRHQVTSPVAQSQSICRSMLHSIMHLRLLTESKLVKIATKSCCLAVIVNAFRHLALPCRCHLHTDPLPASRSGAAATSDLRRELAHACISAAMARLGQDPPVAQHTPAGLSAMLATLIQRFGLPASDDTTGQG